MFGRYFQFEPFQCLNPNLQCILKQLLASDQERVGCKIRWIYYERSVSPFNASNILCNAPIMPAKNTTEENAFHFFIYLQRSQTAYTFHGLKRITFKMFLFIFLSIKNDYCQKRNISYFLLFKSISNHICIIFTNKKIYWL